MIFCNTDEVLDEETRYVNVLLQKQVDGPLVPTGGADETIEFPANHTALLVLLDRRVPGGLLRRWNSFRRV